MSNKTLKTPLILAAGAVLTIGLSATSVVNAADNPFSMTSLSSGYMVASAADGKCGSAKCGANKKAGEAKCGADKKAGEAKCGGDKSGDKGGEAKCGGDKGGDKAGEAKCGGNK